MVHVEGQTEEQVVNEVIAPHLFSRGYASVSARLLGNSRQRSDRGGVRAWSAVRKDIINHLHQSPSYVVSTMVDYYAMPKTGQNAWPGRLEAANRPVEERVLTVEAAMLADLQEHLGPGFDSKRIIPYVSIHEFEALLFSDCGLFASSLGQPDLAGRFQNITDEFETPEHINDSPETAPSKRVLDIYPRYQKPLNGKEAAANIGLESIRHECRHFDNWITRLEEAALSVA